MHTFVNFMVLCVLSEFVTSEITKEPPSKDVSQKTTIKVNGDKTIPDTFDINPKSFWVYRQFDNPSRPYQGASKPTVLKSSHSLTRLTKPHTIGFDPYFDKEYFEPFERRPKPVTLVTFRKNGLLPRKVVKDESDKSSEVAELQSPFNEISSFWQDQY